MNDIQNKCLILIDSSLDELERNNCVTLLSRWATLYEFEREQCEILFVDNSVGRICDEDSEYICLVKNKLESGSYSAIIGWDIFNFIGKRYCSISLLRVALKEHIDILIFTDFLQQSDTLLREVPVGESGKRAINELVEWDKNLFKQMVLNPDINVFVCIFVLRHVFLFYGLGELLYVLNGLNVYELPAGLQVSFLLVLSRFWDDVPDEVKQLYDYLHEEVILEDCKKYTKEFSPGYIAHVCTHELEVLNCLIVKHRKRIVEDNDNRHVLLNIELYRLRLFLSVLLLKGNVISFCDVEPYKQYYSKWEFFNTLSKLPTVENIQYIIRKIDGNVSPKNIESFYSENKIPEFVASLKNADILRASTILKNYFSFCGYIGIVNGLVDIKLYPEIMDEISKLGVFLPAIKEEFSRVEIKCSYDNKPKVSIPFLKELSYDEFLTVFKISEKSMTFSGFYCLWSIANKIPSIKIEWDKEFVTSLFKDEIEAMLRDYETNNVQPSSETQHSDTKDGSNHSGSSYCLPKNFFTHKELYDRKSEFGYRMLESFVFETNNAFAKFTNVINWFTYKKNYIPCTQRDVNMFVLAISGYCPDPELQFTRIKLETRAAANAVSVLIQELCTKPDYMTLNNLFDVQEKYKWKSLDKGHVTELRQILKRYYGNEKVCDKYKNK